MFSLRSYQHDQINEVACFIRDGHRCIVVQLNTGGGKTVEFANICYRICNSLKDRILIMVDREELLVQTCNTIKQWYDIPYQEIVSTTKAIYDKQIYVGMVETVFKRLSSNSYYLPDIKYVILDEAHEGNFKKIHSIFPNATIIAFTATPIYSDSKYTMNKDYSAISVGPQVNELISLGALCQNITYSIDQISWNELEVSRGKFDEKKMGEKYSKQRYVKNVVDAYEEYAPNTKAICYNVNVEHSMLVLEEFRKRGYDCRHVDGKTREDERIEIFKWFKDERPTILLNVGIATKGYDNEFVKTIITNFSTLSLVKWLQCCGRGGRVSRLIDKKFFTVIDMGGNGRHHGDWNMERDWKDIFYNARKPRKKTDAAPYKTCKGCRALIPIQVNTCPYCGYQYPIKEVQYDVKQIKLEIITTNIDVSRLMEINSKHSEFYTLFQIYNNVITQAKYKLGSAQISEENAQLIISLCMSKAEEWAKYLGKDWGKMKRYCKKTLLEKMKEMINYEQKTIQKIESLAQIPIIY